MVEIISTFVLVGVILYQGWLNYVQRKEFRDERNDLLNRLMAREYGTFIQGEIAKKQVDIPEPYEERGIPI